MLAHGSAPHFRMVERKVVPHWLSLGWIPFVYYTECADWLMQKVKVFTCSNFFFLFLRRWWGGVACWKTINSSVIALSVMLLYCGLVLAGIACLLWSRPWCHSGAGHPMGKGDKCSRPQLFPSLPSPHMTDILNITASVTNNTALTLPTSSNQPPHENRNIAWCFNPPT